MSLSVRRLCAAILFASVFLLAGCEVVTPTPRPTWTRTAPTEAPTTTGTPTVAPTAAATAAATAAPRATARPAASAPPKTTNDDPLLPHLGAFPPVPIPSRPSNVNPLTGLTEDPAALARRPIMARIGNDPIVPKSEWQAGLSMADIVFEELTDELKSSYAATRYSAVFLSKDPPLIGPIRSERIVNFQTAPMLDAAFVSAGGSQMTRWLFSLLPIVNLDEEFSPSAYCYMQSHGYQGRLYTTSPRLREYMAGTRSAKSFEVYNGDQLRSYMQQLKVDSAVPLYGFNFSDQAPAGQKAATINLTSSPWPSKESWTFDGGSGTYLRSMEGAPLIDNSYPVTAKWGSGADCTPTGQPTRTQVSTSNVVVLYAKHEATDIIEDSNNYVSVHIVLTGSGDAKFFRDGVMVSGKWQRQNEQDFFDFVDASGKEYNLKPGTTWFEVVPTGFQLDVK